MNLKSLIETAAKKNGITPAEYIQRAILAALERDGLTIEKNVAQTPNLDAWAKEYQKQTGEEISFF